MEPLAFVNVSLKVLIFVSVLSVFEIKFGSNFNSSILSVYSLSLISPLIFDIFKVIKYKTNIWPKKALVEATPTSCPQCIGNTNCASLAIELSTTFTTAQVFILCLLHKSKAAYVSAVSPD